MLRIKQEPRKGNGATYFELTLIPNKVGDTLRQYTLQVVTTVGKGELKASPGKTGTRHNYEKSFTAATPLDTFFFLEGNASAFEAGKSVKIKCMYCPQDPSQDEEPRLTIKAYAHDSDGNMVKEESEEVTFVSPGKTASKATGGKTTADSTDEPAPTKAGPASKAAGDKEPSDSAKKPTSKAPQNKLLRIKQELRKGNGATYFKITLIPNKVGDTLRQYILQAVTTVGKGELKAFTGKTGARHNYEKSFTAATPLSEFAFVKGDAAGFQKGQSVTIRCIYCPQDPPQDEEPQLDITVHAYDSDGNMIKEASEEVAFVSPGKTSSKAARNK